MITDINFSKMNRGPSLNSRNFQWSGTMLTMLTNVRPEMTWFLHLHQRLLVHQMYGREWWQRSMDREGGVIPEKPGLSCGSLDFII